MKKIACFVLLFVFGTQILHAQNIHATARDYLSQSLHNPSSLVIDSITPIDTLTVGESLKIRIDGTDSLRCFVSVRISFTDSVSPEEGKLILEEANKTANDDRKLEHRELLKLRDTLADQLDNILSITYGIKFHANDVHGLPVNYDMVFRVNPEGRITELGTRVGNLRAWVDIIEYNRLRNKLYNEICRWDNYD